MLGDGEQNTVVNGFTPEDMGDSFLDLGEQLGDIPDLQLIPDNTEARVRLTKAEIKETGDNSKVPGTRYINAFLVADDFPNSQGIGHLMMLPSTESDEKQKMNRLRAIKDFCLAFKVSQVGTKLMLSEAANAQPTAWAIIGIEKDQTGQYPDKNRIKRFVVQR
jgi:hypothetical protein